MPQPNSKLAEQAPQTVAITHADLPLYCPRPDTELWSAHPRVFIPIEEAEDHTALCPYCGTVYQLV